jgi:hypothetical protein
MVDTPAKIDRKTLLLSKQIKNQLNVTQTLKSKTIVD